MKLANIVKQLVETRTLTPELKQQINGVLWTSLDQEDLGSLAQVVYLLQSGTVRLQ